MKDDTGLMIKERLLRLANEVREVFLRGKRQDGRMILRRKDGGDPHFGIDELAEQAVERFLRGLDLPVACFSEDRGLVRYHENPEWIFIIDPIDGTRPALANFESCCFSAVVAPYSKHPTFADISHALVLELKSGEYFYADAYWPGVVSSLPGLPCLSRRTSPEEMFWSIELTAHPIRQIARVCGDLIDDSVTLGAVFVFTSSSFSLTRIVTGQLDSHVDVGHRIVQDYPGVMEEFLRTGRGKLVTLFPYDIAAAAFILLKVGGVVTDAYGLPLDDLSLLTDKSLDGQCSIVAASNRKLHDKIMERLDWKGV